MCVYVNKGSLCVVVNLGDIGVSLESIYGNKGCPGDLAVFLSVYMEIMAAWHGCKAKSWNVGVLKSKAQTRAAWSGCGCDSIYGNEDSLDWVCL